MHGLAVWLGADSTVAVGLERVTVSLEAMYTSRGRPPLSGGQLHRRGFGEGSGIVIENELGREQRVQALEYVLEKAA